MLFSTQKRNGVMIGPISAFTMGYEPRLPYFHSAAEIVVGVKWADFR